MESANEPLRGSADASVVAQGGQIATHISDQLDPPVLCDRAAILRLLRQIYEDRSSNLRVVNLWYPQAASRHDQLGKSLAEGLPGILDEQGRGIPVVRLSLGAGSSRASVILQLCEQLATHGDSEALLGPEPELALEAARSVLATRRFAVVLEHWDNASGPLTALDHFLCDTNWTELLRILVHPHRQAPIPGTGTTPSGSIFIALSSSAVAELAPWCKRVVALKESTPGGCHEPSQPAWRNHLDQLLNSDSASARLISCFVAASVDGLRRSTLRRCMVQWSSLFGSAPTVPQRRAQASAGDKIESDIDGLLRQYGALIYRTREGGAERDISEDVRHVELDWRPEVPRHRAGQDHPEVLHFTSREARSQFVTAWLANETADDRGPTWRSVHFVLAEESLRQATARVRHDNGHDRANAHTIRRFAQTIFHGLLSINSQPRGGEGWLPLGGNLHAPAMPTEPAKRFRYLYRFVYRRCVEGEEWWLGRSLGRSDVRVDLLTMFFAPHTACSLLQRFPQWNAATKLLPELFEPEPPLPAPDVMLRCDMLTALARSGLDAGTARGRSSAEWALSVLPGWRQAAQGTDPNNQAEKHQINSRLPRRGIAYSKLSDDALKLRIDWLQSSADEHSLRQAKALCLEQLERVGVSSRFVDDLRLGARHFVEYAWSGAEDPAKALRFAMETSSSLLLAGSPPAHALTMVSDVLSRLGEIIATAADNAVSFDPPNPPDEPIFGLAWACAVYHVSDHVRSTAAGSEAEDLGWPTAGARSLRYNVRACLKLARLLVTGAADPNDRTISKLVETLLIHAQSRLATYARHHFRFHRERGYAKLMESGRIRTWVRVSAHQFSHVAARSIAKQEALRLMADRAMLRRQARKNSLQRNQLESWKKRIREAQKEIDYQCDLLLRHLESQWSILEQAQARLDEAEALLIALGYQRSHVRRLLLERAKLATTAVGILSVSLPLDEATQDAIAMAAVQGIPVDPGMRLDLTPFSRQLSKRLGEIADRQSLKSHVERAGMACEALQAISKGDTFWLDITNRQIETLGLALEKLQTLATVHASGKPRIDSRGGCEAER